MNHYTIQLLNSPVRVLKGRKNAPTLLVEDLAAAIQHHADFTQQWRDALIPQLLKSLRAELRYSLAISKNQIGPCVDYMAFLDLCSTLRTELSEPQNLTVILKQIEDELQLNFDSVFNHLQTNLDDYHNMLADIFNIHFKTYEMEVLWDEEAGVYVGNSDSYGITVEAPTLDALQTEAAETALELLRENNGVMPQFIFKPVSEFSESLLEM